jgi:hypothetical protein
MPQKSKSPVPIEQIDGMIRTIRGVRVMLDRDLAQIYGVPTKVFNQQRFCRKAARLGVPRNPSEGPSDFSRRAAQLLPKESDRIRQISNTYIALRYSPESTAVVLNRFAKEVNQVASHSVGR